MSTPIDIPVVSILKSDHDNFLRMAQEYLSLRDALYKGGIQPETLDVLIHGGDLSTDPTDILTENNNYGETGGIGVVSQPSQARVTLSSPATQPWLQAKTSWPPKSSVDTSKAWSRGKFLSRENSCIQEDDISWDPDLSRESNRDIDSLTIPRTEKKRFAREEQRTILAKNLADRVSHKDITTIVRGGLVLDIFLRSNERSASISFVEASAARDFMNYVKKNDVYIHGKRVRPHIAKYN